MNNVVIVTGAAGFIGSFLCEKLINEGYYVIGADNLFRGKVSNLNNIIKDKKFKFMNIDLNDSYKVNNFLKPYKKIKFFFHLAAINGTEHFYDKSSYVFNNNVNILYNTLDSIKINKTLIENFIFSSSSEVYSDPTKLPTSEDHPIILNIDHERDSYSSSKAFGEFIIKYNKISNIKNYTILRIFNTYGPRMVNDKYGQVIPELIKKFIVDKKVKIIGDGTQSRSFCYILDLVEMIFLISKNNKTNNIFNIGNNKEVRIIELAKTISKLLKSKKVIQKSVNRKNDPKRRNPSLKKLKSKIKYNHKYNLKRGLSETITYYL